MLTLSLAVYASSWTVFLICLSLSYGLKSGETSQTSTTPAAKKALTLSGSGTSNSTIISQYFCSQYYASGTSDARHNYVECAIYACPGWTVSVSLCSSSSICSGDTYLRLYDGDLELASNDDSCGGSCSAITKTLRFGDISTCRDLSLHQGCFSQFSCSGRSWVTTTRTVTTAPPTPLIATPPPTPMPSPRGNTGQYYCPYYSADGSGFNTECPVYACPGWTVSVNLCGRCSGDTYLWLYASGSLLTYNDDACGLCSSFTKTLSHSDISTCQVLSLQQGCLGSCSGQSLVTTYVESNESTSYLLVIGLVIGGSGVALILCLAGCGFVYMQKEKQKGQRLVNESDEIIEIEMSTMSPAHPSLVDEDSDNEALLGQDDDCGL